MKIFFQIIIRFYFLCFLSIHLFADIHSESKNDIDIVYHIATLNNWQSIVEDQLDTLEQSGLADAADSITVTVVGEKILKVYRLFETKPFYDKVKIIYAGPNLRQYEFPGIHEVQEIAQKKPHTHVFYMHSKGVLHRKPPISNNVRLWRHYMEYFTIEKWKDCIEALKEADICGVDWESIKPKPHFSGNFWWGRASYINTCQLETNKRHDCEFFIGTGKNPLVKSFYQSAESLKVTNRYTSDELSKFLVSYNKDYPSILKNRLNLYNFEYLEEYYRDINN